MSSKYESMNGRLQTFAEVWIWQDSDSKKNFLLKISQNPETKARAQNIFSWINLMAYRKKSYDKTRDQAASS